MTFPFHYGDYINISAVRVWPTGRFLSFLDKGKICGEDALMLRLTRCY
jgi:hypothetical protein